MSDQDKNTDSSAAQTTDDDANAVHIQPSEIDSDTEENAPGRTAGKAEGSRETIEADLKDKEEN